ncbi:hypothetical protein ES703_56473 [subsurface metagenome]
MNSRRSTGASDDMSQTKPPICVDIDNVIAKTDEVMRKVIRAHSRLHVDLAYEDVVCFEYWMCRDRAGRRFDKGEWAEIHRAFTDNHLLEILPFDNVTHHLKIISGRFDVHLATSRLDDGQEETRVWLSRHGIPYEKLHFVPEGTKHLIDEQFVAAIEDDREQGYAFYSKGICVFLLAHPWNTVGPHSPLKRVTDWEELTHELLNLPFRDNCHGIQ